MAQSQSLCHAPAVLSSISDLQGSVPTQHREECGWLLILAKKVVNSWKTRLADHTTPKLTG